MRCPNPHDVRLDYNASVPRYGNSELYRLGTMEERTLALLLQNVLLTNESAISPLKVLDLCERREIDAAK